jgi:squalene cyclase
MIHIQSAAAFVNSHGDATEQARLRYLLNGERPSQAAVNTLLAGQREDGGWAPFWAPAYSSLDATCFHLAQAEQLGLTIAITNSEPAIGRALGFLTQRQRASGRWAEDESVTDLAPPWAKPGETSATLYLTAKHLASYPEPARSI